MIEQATDVAEVATVQVTLETRRFRLESRATVPTGPTTAFALLPLARSLADDVVAATADAVARFGGRISCRSGCGACCRNLVAISAIEARRIRAVVEALPEPRRSMVQTRFERARERLREAGLLESLRASGQWTREQYERLVGEYFALGIPCPFLEDESCSIYEERPITCREFLVVSPPECCARVGSEGVVRVRLPLRVASAVAQWHVRSSAHVAGRWVPLVLAPEWADANPDDEAPKPGLALLEDLLRLLDDGWSGQDPAAGEETSPDRRTDDR